MNDQLEKMEISISSSSSSSISSMTSNTCQQQPQSDIETILELVEALDLNPELFEKSEINKTHLMSLSGLLLSFLIFNLFTKKLVDPPEPCKTSDHDEEKK